MKRAKNIKTTGADWLFSSEKGPGGRFNTGRKARRAYGGKEFIGWTGPSKLIIKPFPMPDLIEFHHG